MSSHSCYKVRFSCSNCDFERFKECSKGGGDRWFYMMKRLHNKKCPRSGRTVPITTMEEHFRKDLLSTDKLEARDYGAGEDTRNTKFDFILKGNSRAALSKSRRWRFDELITNYLQSLEKFEDKEKRAFWKWGASQLDEPELAGLFQEAIDKTDRKRLMLIDLAGAVNIAQTFSLPESSEKKGIECSHINPCMKYAGNCLPSNFKQLSKELIKDPNAKMFYILQGENEIFHAIVVSKGKMFDVSNGKFVCGSYEAYKKVIPHRVFGECEVKRTETVLEDGKRCIQVENLTTDEDLAVMLLHARK